MPFRILGLEPTQFAPLFELSDAELKARGARRLVADDPRMPCRVSLEHARLGEEVLLLHHEHQPADTPYRASHAIYVRRAASRAYDRVDEVPDVMSTRLLSVRAFDASHDIVDAEVCEGPRAAVLFERFLADPRIDYLHVHNAAFGCYSARVERA